MVIFLNGWASNENVWGELPALTGGYCYDLSKGNAMKEYLRVVAALLLHHKEATLVGWSLGGMVALEIAAALPQKIKRLILIATTPRFTVGDEYQHGLSATVVKQLTRKVQRDPAAAQEQFYPLMFSEQEHEQYQLFQANLAKKVMTSNQSFLQDGLHFLATKDLRSLLSKVTAQAQVIHGFEDAICPFGAAEYLTAHLPHAELIGVPGCGHIPFFTQSQICRQVMLSL
ncbi:alpha/beta fold hydrolase [Anaeroarcus burkinensis]|uniref:alpha/beta fold hydrolase n=1 Tax=Anaeroarcus burkinensis TaxID=82376 RepID=UPI00041F97EA|nr:alpha/beta fold hydrolase [Anaeroarcus burkinensis]